jgi:hypothetical protein
MFVTDLHSPIIAIIGASMRLIFAWETIADIKANHGSSDKVDFLQ